MHIPKYICVDTYNYKYNGSIIQDAFSAADFYNARTTFEYEIYIFYSIVR